MFFRKSALWLTAALLLVAGSARAETEFTFTSWIPWNHALNQYLYIPWAKAVEEASGGEIKIRMLPKAVAAPAATLDAVRTGQADIGFGTHSYSPELFAAYNFTDFPLIGDTATGTSIALQRTHDRFFADKNMYEGTHVIGMNTLGPGIFFDRQKLLLTTDDFNGRKMRSGGEVLTRIVEKLGGVAVAQPVTKTYELLSTGVVDGHVGRWEHVVGFKVGEVAKFVTTVPGGLGSSSNYLVVNKEKYDSLSPEGKAAFDKYSGEVFARMAGEAWDRINEEGRAAGEEQNVAVQETSPEVVRVVEEVAGQFEAEYVTQVSAEGIDGKAVLEYFHAQVKELEGE